MKYIKLKSLTWWSSVILATVQLARAVGVHIPEGTDEVIMGAIAIGLRAKMGG